MVGLSSNCLHNIAVSSANNLDRGLLTGIITASGVLRADRARKTTVPARDTTREVVRALKSATYALATNNRYITTLFHARQRSNSPRHAYQLQKDPNLAQNTFHHYSTSMQVAHGRVTRASSRSRSLEPGTAASNMTTKGKGKPATQQPVSAKGKGKALGPVIELSDSDDDELPSYLSQKKSQPTTKTQTPRINAVASGSQPRADSSTMKKAQQHLANSGSDKENRGTQGKGKTAAPVDSVPHDDDDESDLEGYDPTFASKPFPFDDAFFAAARAMPKSQSQNAVAGPSHVTQTPVATSAPVPAQSPKPPHIATHTPQRAPSIDGRHPVKTGKRRSQNNDPPSVAPRADAHPPPKHVQDIFSSGLAPRASVEIRMPPPAASQATVHLPPKHFNGIFAPPASNTPPAAAPGRAPAVPANPPTPTAAATPAPTLADATAQVLEVFPNADRARLAQMLQSNLPVYGNMTVFLALQTLLNESNNVNVAGAPAAAAAPPIAPATIPVARPPVQIPTPAVPDVPAGPPVRCDCPRNVHLNNAPNPAPAPQPPAPPVHAANAPAPVPAAAEPVPTLADATAQILEVIPTADRTRVNGLVQANLPTLRERTVPLVLQLLLEEAERDAAGANPAPPRAAAAAPPPAPAPAARPAAPAAPVPAPVPAPQPAGRPAAAPPPAAAPGPAPPPAAAPAPLVADLVGPATDQILEVIPDLQRAYLARMLAANLPVHGARTAEVLLAALIEGGGWPVEGGGNAPAVAPGAGGAGAAVVGGEAGGRDKGKARARDEDEPPAREREAKRARIVYASTDRPHAMWGRYAEMALLALECTFPHIPRPYLRAQLFAHKLLYAPTHLALRASEAAPAPRRYVAKTKLFQATSGLLRLNRMRGMEPDFHAERDWVLEREGGGAAAGPAAAPLDKGKGKAAGAPPTVANAPEDIKGKGKARADPAPVPEPAAAAVGDDEADGGIECQCCFGEYAFDKMVQCPEAHLFCSECVASYAGTQLGQQSAALVCMHPSGCALPFPASELARVLAPKLMALYDRLTQQKAIEDAGLEGLEECPFCEWKCVWDAQEGETRFWCGNKDSCGAVSCRLCKKKDHLPKSCEEAEADKHLDGRHAIEEAMTRALMRNCPKCKKGFIKEQGCNKMTCPYCRTLSCYVCREVITGYEHFHQNNPNIPSTSAAAAGKCLLWDNIEERHAAEVKAAAEKATAEYKAAHPDADDAQIKVDIPVAPPPAAVPAPPPAPVAGPAHFLGGIYAGHAQAQAHAAERVREWERQNRRFEARVREVQERERLMAEQRRAVEAQRAEERRMLEAQRAVERRMLEARYAAQQEEQLRVARENRAAQQAAAAARLAQVAAVQQRMARDEAIRKAQARGAGNGHAKAQRRKKGGKKG